MYSARISALSPFARFQKGRDNSFLVLLERDDLHTEAYFSRRMLLRKGPQYRLKIILGAVAIPNRAYRRGLWTGAPGNAALDLLASERAGPDDQTRVKGRKPRR